MPAPTIFGLELMADGEVNYAKLNERVIIAYCLAAKQLEGRDQTTPPGTIVDYTVFHIATSGASAPWDAHHDRIAIGFNGSWLYTDTPNGWLTYDAGADKIVLRAAGSWHEQAGDPTP